MLKINAEVCATVHVDHMNPGFIYELNEKDLKMS